METEEDKSLCDVFLVLSSYYMEKVKKYKNTRKKETSLFLSDTGICWDVGVVSSSQLFEKEQPNLTNFV